MYWSQLDRTEVDTDLVLLQTSIGSLYLKIEINFVAGCSAWLGCYHSYSTYAATFHTYLKIVCRCKVWRCSRNGIKNPKLRQGRQDTRVF
jgi:hypothetical protein